MPATRTALIADDDPATRDLMQQVLALFGYAVLSFDDGEPLVLAALSTPPDLVVTDQHMLRLSGTEALGRIRTAGALCPAVLLTAFPAPELTLEVQRLGSCALLAKPVDLGQLRATLEALGCLV